MSKNLRNLVLHSLTSVKSGNIMLNAADAKVTHKRRSMEISNAGNNSNDMAVEKGQPEKKSVKRKIDFLNESVASKSQQINNNATVREIKETKDLKQKVMVNEPIITRSRIQSNPKADHVQWTQEFLNKVRRSNEKHKLKKQVKTNKNSNKTVLLQAKPQGDGIDTSVEVCDISDEESDYEDDLSIDGGDTTEFDQLDHSQVEATTSGESNDVQDKQNHGPRSSKEFLNQIN